MRFSAVVALLLLVLCSASINCVVAEEKRDSVTISGAAERDSVARQIDTIDELIRQENWSKAIDQCQVVLGKNAEALAPLSADHLVQAHILVHQRIAGLPASALKMYRSRVAGQAKKLYEEGLAKRDVAVLKRLIKEAFCSKYGEEGLELLGDLAFEQGRFEEAQRWWTMIALPASESSLKNLPKEALSKSAGLLYPSPQKNLAPIRAKQMLSLLFMGDRAKFDYEMKSFREIHSKAEGALAGQKGNLAKILEGVSKSIAPANEGPMLSSWPTFAGASDRQGAHGSLPSHPNWLAHLCAEPPCRFDLVRRQVVNAKANAEPERPKTTTTSFPYFPAIVDRFVLVADGSGVALYDPINGKSTVWQTKGLLNNVQEPEPNHTVTVDQNKAYACFGQDANSKLVCLDVDLGANPSVLERWQVGASSLGEKEPWVFEGSPVVENGRAFVSVSQKTASQTNHAVICYNADTGTTLWRREVCHAARLDAAQPSPTCNLLTLSEGRVYFCSHSGAISCLDSFSGQIIWAVRYPLRSASPPARVATLRPSSPCVVANGLLFAAPLDSNRLLCLDAFSGQLLWSREGQEGIQLLGVGQHRLVFTTKQGIRWLDTATGADVQSHPDGGTGSLPSRGRGLLAGNLVFWPTQQGLFVLTQKDGDFPDDLNVYHILKGQPLGNLALTSKVMAVAGPHEMNIYASPALKRDQLRKELDKNPKSIKVLTRQAWADLDSLNFREAADRLALAAEQVRTLYDPQEKQALPVILSEQHLALCRLGERLDQRSSLEEAERCLASASGSSFSPNQQALAKFQKAQMLHDAGRIDQAMAAWQSILSESRFRLERLYDEAGLSQPAVWLAARNIDSIVRESGPEKYPDIATKARERSAVTGQDPQEKGKSNEIIGIWQRGFEISLHPDERLLLDIGGSLSDFFFTANKRLVACRDRSTGAIRWQTVLQDDPGWIARERDLVAVGGASSLSVLSLENGEILWQYRPRSVDGRPSALSCFQLQDRRVFCLEGQRRILAFDLEKGTCLWRHGLLGATLGLPRVFNSWAPHFVVQNQFVLVSSPSSKAKVFDAETGNILQEVDLGPETTFQQWKCAKSNLKCLAVSASQMLMMDFATGKPAWAHVFEGSSTLRNELPTVLGHEDNLVVLIRRNYGDTLLRLDPTTGQKLWSEEQWLGGARCNPTSIETSPSAILLALDSSLMARSLADGRIIWERSLPEAHDGWSLSIVNEDIVCRPNQESSETRQGIKSMSWAFSHPWGSLECQVSYAEDRGDLMTTPLLIADVKTGEPRQRFRLDSNPTSLTIANGPGVTRPESYSGPNARPANDSHHAAISIQKGQILITSRGALWEIHAKPLVKTAHAGSGGD